MKYKKSLIVATLFLMFGVINNVIYNSKNEQHKFIMMIKGGRALNKYVDYETDDIDIILMPKSSEQGSTDKSILKKYKDSNTKGFAQEIVEFIYDTLKDAVEEVLQMNGFMLAEGESYLSMLGPQPTNPVIYKMSIRTLQGYSAICDFAFKWKDDELDIDHTPTLKFFKDKTITSPQMSINKHNMNALYITQTLENMKAEREFIRDHSDDKRTKEKIEKQMDLLKGVF